MANIVLVAYLLIVLTMIAVILLQRSEGGGLGMGGGGGGGFMTARGSANLLTRTTAILAALFFATAIGLTVLSDLDRPSEGILDRASQGTTDSEGGGSVLDALNNLQGDEDSGLPVPATEGATPEEATPPAAATSTGSDAGAVDEPDLPVPDQDTAPEQTSGGQ